MAKAEEAWTQLATRIPQDFTEAILDIKLARGTIDPPEIRAVGSWMCARQPCSSRFSSA